MTNEVLDLQGVSFEDLSSPLFLAWHLTNRCNLECIHCLWEAGPRSSWPDELSGEEAMKLCREVVDLQVPYVALSGGEPLLHPAFWRVCEFLREHDIGIKIETNGLLISKDVAYRLTKLELRSVQVSLDGASQETYSRMRPGASFNKVIDAIRRLVAEGVKTEIVFVPARFSLHEIERLVDLAAELGVKSFYTGKTMYIGRAVKYWDVICPTDEEYEWFTSTLDKKAKEYEGRMSIFYYPYDVIEELKYRLEHPAASVLVMANGKVKLIGSMPFVCGHVRKHRLNEIWERYKKSWKRPEVAEYVRSVLEKPSLLAEANNFLELDLG
ncbi:MAG: radical SAM protein [Nitrososphaerales archaeon]